MAKVTVSRRGLLFPQLNRQAFVEQPRRTADLANGETERLCCENMQNSFFFFSHNSDAVQKNDVDFLLMSNASSTFHVHFDSYVGQACLPSVLPRSLPSKVGTRTLQFNYSLIASFVQRLNTRYPFSFGKVHFWVTPLSIRMLESALRSTYTSSLIYFIRKGGTADLGRSEFIGAQGPSNEKDRQINGVCIIQRFLP